MRSITFLGIFLLSSVSMAACLPDSQMGLKSKMMNNLTINMKGIEETVSKFESIVVRELPDNHELIINLAANNPRVNAEILKNEQELTISVWGGMLGHSLMSPDTFLLLLCHELGHFLGGPPLKSRNGWSSTEGQADYYSTNKCIRSFGLAEEDVLSAALNLTTIYAQVTSQGTPSVDRCDTVKVERTNYGYPLVQCRLDTLLAGWRQDSRPSCWFKQN